MMMTSHWCSAALPHEHLCAIGYAAMPQVDHRHSDASMTGDSPRPSRGPHVTVRVVTAVRHVCVSCAASSESRRWASPWPSRVWSFLRVAVAVTVVVLVSLIVAAPAMACVRCRCCCHCLCSAGIIPSRASVDSLPPCVIVTVPSLARCPCPVAVNAGFNGVTAIHFNT